MKSFKLKINKKIFSNINLSIHTFINKVISKIKTKVTVFKNSPFFLENKFILDYISKLFKGVIKFFPKNKSTFITIFTLLISILFFSTIIKGGKGNPIYYQVEHNKQIGGPFEDSISSARYALTESIVLNQSLFLSPSLAEFAAPDVVYYKGKFTSVFTPGISFLGVPFYFIGSLLGLPQLFTYFATILFAILDIFLIARIAVKVGSSYLAGIIGGCIFIFCTNALTYGINFTQHDVTAAVVLLALLNAFSKRNWINNTLFGVLVGASLLIDIPNIIFLAPIGLYILAKSFSFKQIRTRTQLIFNTTIFGFIVGFIPLIMLFGWYNYQTTGSYTKLAQSIGITSMFSKNVPPQFAPNKPSTAQPVSFNFNLHIPFETRIQVEGLYILLLSNERSWIFYSPIVFVGLIGFILLYTKIETRSKSLLILSIIIVNILLYSMFDDPWGGWAFGPRYLIPSAALLTTMIPAAIDRFRKNIIFILLFVILLYYSIWVNVLGALTTSAIPPKVEAVALPTHIPWTYKYNEQLISTGLLTSLIYNLFLTNLISPNFYWNILTISIFVFFIILYILQFTKTDRVEFFQSISHGFYIKNKFKSVFNRLFKSH